MNSGIRRKKLPSGKIHYYVYAEVDGCEHGCGGFERKTHAQARLELVQSKIAAGTFNAPEAITFGEFYERWIAGKHNLKESTLVSYEHTFRRHILPTFKGRKLDEITPMDVQGWVDDLATLERRSKDADKHSKVRMSPTTVARCFRYFRACMKQAEAWDLILRSPTSKIILPRKDSPELDFLSPTEIRKLLEVAKEPERSLFALLAMSGLRLGEAQALYWRDIDYEVACIKVIRSWSNHGGLQDPKTPSSRRSVPLVDELADELRGYYDGCGRQDPDDFLFSANGQTPLDQANARKAFLKALKAAGLRHVTMQSLRHSYATVLLSYGASIKAVQHALGHASATMTLNVYGHYIPAEIDHGALSKLGRQVAGDGKNVVEFPRLSNTETP